MNIHFSLLKLQPETEPTHSFDILIHLKFLLIHPRDKMRNPEVFEDDPGKYEILYIYWFNTVACFNSVTCYSS